MLLLLCLYYICLRFCLPLSLPSAQHRCCCIITYHKRHNIITCVCGQQIDGTHECVMKKPHTMIKVVECIYDMHCDGSIPYCPVCDEAAKKKAFEEQWYIDRDGYSLCEECGHKSDWGEVPKMCGCMVYDVGEEHRFVDGQCVCTGCDDVLADGPEELCKKCDVWWCVECKREYVGKDAEDCPCLVNLKDTGTDSSAVKT